MVSRGSAPRFEENLRRGAKPETDWMCGVEFELFGYDAVRDAARLNPAQVQRVLAGFAPSSNNLVYEGRVLVEVDAGQMNRLTVEPGGRWNSQARRSAGSRMSRAKSSVIWLVSQRLPKASA